MKSHTNQFVQIDTLLKAMGCKKEEKENSGNGSTACITYTTADKHFKYNILVQATPKKEAIYTLLERGDSEESGGN